MSKRDSHVNVPVTTASLFAVFFAVTGAAIAVGGTRIAGISGAQESTATTDVSASVFPPPTDGATGLPSGSTGFQPGSTKGFPPMTGGYPSGSTGFPGDGYSDYRGPGDGYSDYHGGPGYSGPGGGGFQGGLYPSGPRMPGGMMGGPGGPFPPYPGMSGPGFQGDPWSGDQNWDPRNNGRGIQGEGNESGPECYFATKGPRGDYMCDQGGWWTEFEPGRALCVNRPYLTIDGCADQLGLRVDGQWRVGDERGRDWEEGDWDRGEWERGDWDGGDWEDENNYDFVCESSARDGTVEKNVDGYTVHVAPGHMEQQDAEECACELYGDKDTGLCERFGGGGHGGPWDDEGQWDRGFPGMGMPPGMDPQMMREMMMRKGMKGFEGGMMGKGGFEGEFGPMHGMPGPKFDGPRFDRSAVDNLSGTLQDAIPMLIGMATDPNLPAAARTAITAAIEVVTNVVSNIPTLIKNDDDAAIIAAMKEVQAAIEGVMKSMMGGHLAARIVEEAGTMVQVALEALDIFEKDVPDVVAEQRPIVEAAIAAIDDIKTDIEAGVSLQDVKKTLITKVIGPMGALERIITTLAQFGDISPESMEKADQLFARVGGGGKHGGPGPYPGPYDEPYPMQGPYDQMAPEFDQGDVVPMPVN